MERHERHYVLALLGRADPSGHSEAARIITRHLTRGIENAAPTRNQDALEDVLDDLAQVLEDVKAMWKDMPQTLPIDNIDKPSRGA